MNIYIDCEWNDWQGDLISMALVAESGSEFYAVLGVENPSDWIVKNVVPHISPNESISWEDFQIALAEFLGIYDSVHIIADWPEDIMHFCRALIITPGERIHTGKLTFEIVRGLNEESEVPHHALHDARAIATAHQRRFIDRGNP